ncbi:MAG: tetrahydromethanopterin S-methyltransferase subunit G [Arcticibacterium sp.]|jgi:tetrahydromethanopterin S-methyltransferase subunit G
MRKILAPLFAVSILLTSCWKNKSPEDLPRLKEAFQKQVEAFEKDKNTTNENVTDGLEALNGLQGALETAKNEDKEFAKVYGDWEKVDKRVNDLNKEYEDLKAKAEGLFTAMETQTNSLADAKSKADLNAAIKSARVKYNGTLVKTSKAIQKLRVLHSDAVDVVKALEVAVALNSFDNINEQLKGIEGRVDGIMAELNVAVLESKKLYDKRLDELQ